MPIALARSRKMSAGKCAASAISRSVSMMICRWLRKYSGSVDIASPPNSAPAPAAVSASAMNTVSERPSFGRGVRVSRAMAWK